MLPSKQSHDKKKKLSKAWLHLIEKGDYSSRSNICYMITSAATYRNLFLHNMGFTFRNDVFDGLLICSRGASATNQTD